MKKNEISQRLKITDRLTNLIETNKFILEQQFISDGELRVKVRDIIKDREGKILFKLESKYGLTDIQLEGIVLRIIRSRKIDEIINEKREFNI